MARKFREISRGWTDDAGSVDVTNSDIGNIVTEWTPCALSGQDLLQASQGEAVMGTERNPDYWIERLIVWWTAFAIPTALNTSGYLDAWIGLAIVETGVADQVDTFPASLTNNPWWSAIPRGTEELVRLLRVEPCRLLVNGIARDFEDANRSKWAPADGTHKMFDVKNIFLQRGESVVIFMSQAGVQDDYQQWIQGDAGRLHYMSQALVRQKRGR